ncbi:tyrosine-type recombinase/integrase [Bradyrhizobium pachyrhizi]|uniref:Tyrosine-type recombinase/integrase n=1 Tax=Bradyrhizobium pachyrhizi TaxID=280333 RepID=A0A844SGG8_9BRAD|nr:tyrosine-type recombinase/integrase [Bradyrhizobium pachyrhizi]MVT64847.1 tyrosine-type recombinase/integrase [Bradyrhizobium pachyrhizi]
MPDDIIRDKAGRPVDCSTEIWRLNTAGTAIVLDWNQLTRLPEPVRDAARKYARDRIPNWAPPSVGGLFYMYRLLSECAYFEQFDGTVGMRAFEELRQDDRAASAELTRYRIWYEWAATFGFPGFDRAVAKQLNKVRIGANPHGRRARKKVPGLGPLTDEERQELLNKALDASEEELPLAERVAVLLGMGLGPNSGPLSLLQVGDYKPETSGDTTYHVLMVPRHKKGFERERADFRARPLEARWAGYLSRLIENNERQADEIYRMSTGAPKPASIKIPIFMRRRIRTDLNSAMEEYALHMTPLEFNQLLKDACVHLNAVSRENKPLHLNQRRLRTTFATNLIANGMSLRQVADALDHLSTGSVKRYDFGNYRLVESLDARIGAAMERVAGAFLGTLTERSSEAERNRSPSSRRPFFDQDRSCGEDLGNCGSNCKCELPVPLACYTCRLFEPWVDAPHERLLEQLMADREQRKASGMHPRMVGIQDRAIVALAEVVGQIKARNSGTK